MGEEKESSSTIADEIEDLFDLVKEGASYILHIYLFFLSKAVPLDFAEKLFDNHKEKSSYDFKNDGKTFIYRLSSCILKVEKHFVAMGLHYLYNTIPLPFIKKLYENFCVNNNLKCTDVKLKKCKKALIGKEKPILDQETHDDEEESVAPVAKKVDLDPVKALQQTIDENHQILQKNLNDLGKSLQNVFSAPQPTPPEEPSPGKILSAPKLEPSDQRSENLQTPIAPGEPPSSSTQNKPPEEQIVEGPLQTLQHNMEQNQKNFEKGVEDFGKSIQNAFSGTQTPSTTL